MPLIFQYDFMIRAFLAGIVVAVIAPLIGVFLVVRRYSLLADTLSHVSLLGVAAGAVFRFNPMVGAIAVSVLAALGIDRLREKRKMFGESVLALFLSGSLALAIVLLGVSHNLNVNIFSYLFGSIATVSAGDVRLVAVLGVAVLAATILLFRKIFVVAYDEELAKAGGLPVRALNTALMLLAGITVSLSIRVVGVLLVGALMVIPVLTTSQFSKSFFKTTVHSIALSLIAVIAGLFASFYLDIPSGGTIVVIALLMFAASLVGKGSRE
ncbi:MAG: ABC transporter [Candidatus Uhrbacteria bacterium]